MTQFIPRENLQTCYGGNDKWEYKYVEPVLGENERLRSEEKKVKIQGEREDLIDQFTRLTAEWVSLEPEGDAGKEKNIQRCDVVKELEENYWQLDPYVRSTTYYHRVGVLNRQGEVDFQAARSI
jgi:hypothetical protein